MEAVVPAGVDALSTGLRLLTLVGPAIPNMQAIWHFYPDASAGFASILLQLELADLLFLRQSPAGHLKFIITDQPACESGLAASQRFE